MIDEGKIKEAVRLLLEGIGEDPDREGLAETPDRVARMYGELFSGMGADPAEPLSRVFLMEIEEADVLRETRLWKAAPLPGI